MNEATNEPGPTSFSTFPTAPDMSKQPEEETKQNKTKHQTARQEPRND